LPGESRGTEVPLNIGAVGKLSENLFENFLPEMKNFELKTTILGNFGGKLKF